jgi:transposase
MGRRKHRRYTAEFREEAVRLAQTGEKSVTETAKDLGIVPGTLLHWVKESEGNGRMPQEAQNETIEEANKRLTKENERLRMEREILKKATAFFVKENG